MASLTRTIRRRIEWTKSDIEENNSGSVHVKTKMTKENA